MKEQHENDGFYLDQCLPYQIADALAIVEYQIQSSFRSEMDGVLDDDLIPWLGERNLVWITKDDAAKREHAPKIIKAGISVVWVRGVGGKYIDTSTKKFISLRHLFIMLAVNLPKVERILSESRTPLYFTSWMNVDTPTLKVLRSPNEDVGSKSRQRRR